MSAIRYPQPRRLSPVAIAAIIWTLVAALTVVPYSSAYVPGTFAPNHEQPNGPPADVKSGIDIAPNPVVPGGDVTYTITGQAKAPKPNTTNAPGQSNVLYAQVEFTPSEHAPLKAAPQATDFTWSDGVRRTFAEEPKLVNGTWVLTFNAGGADFGANPSYKASLVGSTSADISAEEITAKVKTTVNIDPVLNWRSTRPTLTPLGNCTYQAVQENTYLGDGYGAWLMHIKLGSDGWNQELDPNGPKLQVFDETGADVTERFAHYRFNSQDYTQPVYPETNAGVSPYNQWKQSLNYNFDQSTNTGDTWIRDGYKVRITQTIRDTTCSYGASYIHYNVGIESAFPPIYSSDEATASVPVELSKKFRVEKSTDAGRVVLTPEQVRGAASFDVKYKVTVTNDGRVAGVHPDVTDVPAAREGFEVQGVSVDGQVLDAPYVIKGQSLAAGASRTYDVVVSYRVADAGRVDWSSVGKCESSGGQSSGGLVNRVQMEGDSDGPGNNDACVPVIPPNEDTPFVPIPIVPIPVVPTPVVPTPVVPTPDGSQPTQKPSEKGSNSGKALAKTGASVLAPIAIGLIMLALGIAILRRRNTE